MSLGRNLMLQLYDKKISQQEIAEVAGVTEAMISRVISGERDISSQKLKKIAERLSVTVDELLQ